MIQRWGARRLVLTGLVVTAAWLPMMATASSFSTALAPRMKALEDLVSSQERIALTVDFAAHQKQLTDLTAADTALKTQLTDTEGKLRSAQEQLSVLQMSNKELQSSLEAKKGELTKKVADLIREKGELGQKLADVAARALERFVQGLHRAGVVHALDAAQRVLRSPVLHLG